MNNIASELNNGLGALKILYSLGKTAYVKAKTRFSTPLRVEKLSDEVFSGNLKYGSIVTINGILSKYGTVFRPSTYAYAIPRYTKHKKVGGLIRNKFTGKYVQNNEIISHIKPFQFPVQTLPKITDDKGSSHCIAFLYPSQLDTFILAPDPTEVSGEEFQKRLSIKAANRPIPILLPEETLENYAETEVTITGVVSLFSDDLINLFSNSMCEIRQDYFYGFFRPYTNKVAFCLDCREGINFDIKEKRKIQNLRAAIYVEGHFEGINDDRYIEIYKNSIPQGLKFQIAYNPYPDIAFYLTENQDVSIMSFKSNIFGFYIETDLTDQRKLQSSIKELEAFYNTFRKKSCNDIRITHGNDIRFKPDFVFDYKKQFLFHPEGVLNSKELKQVLEEKPELNDTVSWIKNKNNG